ncbi:MAG: hypothetical protein LBQ83_02290 [Candidatus Margulisbacteria bacterium]|nr:hypothetical protein [Candidatus Margulisiibacteriota bacterium]
MLEINRRIADAGIVSNTDIQPEYLSLATEMGCYALKPLHDLTPALHSPGGGGRPKIPDPAPVFTRLPDPGGNDSDLETCIKPSDPEIDRLLNNIPELFDPSLSIQEKLAKIYNQILRDNPIHILSGQWNGGLL